MDSFNCGNIKREKANALKKHRQLQKIANLFRFVEICIVLALISRFSIRLPIVVKNSSEYFKDLTLILVSPCFVFILGNAIVITLFAKSGQFSGSKNSSTDIYQEFLQKSERNNGIHSHDVQNRTKQSINREKQSTCVEHKVAKEEKTCPSLEIKNYQRSKSEKLLIKYNPNKCCGELRRSSTEKLLIKDNPNKCCGELRRSSTEKLRENVVSGEGWVNLSYPEDNMSNEEFKSAIEAFIARQKRFRRDEENSVI